MKLPIALIALCLLAGGVMAECDPSTAWDSYPKLPMGCNPYHVWIDGELAPVGTYITFSGENVRDGGYIYTDEIGGCGEWNAFQPKLMIQGKQSADKCGMLNIQTESPITFYVNGVQAKVRIVRDIDCGVWYFKNDDTTWYDSIPFKEGATYDIELKVGDSEPAPIIEPAMTEPCDSWDRDNVKWQPEDQYWLDKWDHSTLKEVEVNCNGVIKIEMIPEDKWISDWFRSLGSDWFIPGYSHDQTEERYQRMVFFADHGGYGCSPNLTAMVDGQGWNNMYNSYGWPYPIGKFGWTRVTASECGENNLPSLFCPPLNHPVLIENGYTYSPEPIPTPTPTPTPDPTPEPTPEATIEPLIQTMLYVKEETAPTIVPTTMPTTAPTTIPTQTPSLITDWSNDGTICFVLVWDTHVEKYVWARAMLS